MAKTRSTRAVSAGVDALRDRISELEVRLAAIEAGLEDRSLTHGDVGHSGVLTPDADGPDGASGTPGGPSSPIPFTPADLRERLGKPGGVLLTGTARLPRGVRAAWQREAATTDLLDIDWMPTADTLAALAHPVRLALLREVLRGARTVSALASLPGSGTSGQLYHHLKPLVAEGWLQSAGRGRYEVPEDRIVPLLAIMAAVAPRGRNPMPPVPPRAFADRH